MVEKEVRGEPETNNDSEDYILEIFPGSSTQKPYRVAVDPKDVKDGTTIRDIVHKALNPQGYIPKTKRSALDSVKTEYEHPNGRKIIIDGEEIDPTAPAGDIEGLFEEVNEERQGKRVKYFRAKITISRERTGGSNLENLTKEYSGLINHNAWNHRFNIF